MDVNNEDGLLINEDKLMSQIIDKVHANNSDFQKSVSSALAKRTVNDALKPHKSMDFGALFEMNKEFQEEDKENHVNQKHVELNKKTKTESNPKSKKSAKQLTTKNTTKKILK